MTRTEANNTLAVLLLLICLMPAACQRADHRQRMEQEVMRLEHALNTALIQGNLTVMDQSLADGYVWTTPAGRVVTKAEKMTAFANGESRFESFAVDEARVEQHGPSALLTARASIRGHAAGRELSGLYRYTRLYARPQDRLQLVSSQWTSIAPAEMGSNTEAAAAAEIVTVRPGDTSTTRQRHRQFVGISGATAGAKGISMNLVVIPPGGQADPHRHRGYETAIYVLQGRAETCYGPGLTRSVMNQAGDFVYIPPDVPHQPRNLSDTEPVLAIVARNDPDEQESVVPYEPVPGH